MSQTVIIKSNKYGINLILDPNVSFRELLAAIIEKAKAEKRAKRFDECVGNIFHLFFYQYVENFHCKPDTIDDLFSGLKYLIYAREDR